MEEGCSKLGSRDIGRKWGKILEKKKRDIRRKGGGI